MRTFLISFKVLLVFVDSLKILPVKNLKYREIQAWHSSVALENPSLDADLV